MAGQPAHWRPADQRQRAGVPESATDLRQQRRAVTAVGARRMQARPGRAKLLREQPTLLAGELAVAAVGLLQSAIRSELAADSQAFEIGHRTIAPRCGVAMLDLRLARLEATARMEDAARDFLRLGSRAELFSFFLNHLIAAPGGEPTA